MVGMNGFNRWKSFSLLMSSANGIILKGKKSTQRNNTYGFTLVHSSIVVPSVAMYYKTEQRNHIIITILSLTLKSLGGDSKILNKAHYASKPPLEPRGNLKHT